MNIAIIDDSVEEARQLSGYVQTYFHSVHILQRTELFTAAADFLQVWKKDSYQLVFIDIYLGQETLGLEIAEQIRREDESCIIIFTTSSSDFALKGYEVRALDYLLKPIGYDRFCRAMEYAHRELENTGRYIEVKVSRIMVKILLDDICYADYSNHYIQIHTPRRMYRTYMRFEDFSRLLLCYPQFLCCYRNCIINMDRVVEMERNEFLLASGDRIPISRSMRLAIHQQYADYQFKHLHDGISGG
ncbi:DNA-binding response regulator [Clostridium sp. AF18-27]|uniref:LytR/AlgR family response regulator transcription factor n=1 Tax=Enterocloster lavalensis TaxID=460384 RepID=UPI000E4903E1|nr:LytTR family DNA-binding domain-containing protein [Enterocloster lavalensis]MBS5605158.1 response regulator transcription factor [Enterocloster asparagiformis]MCB6342272.1 LytTR family DNA-binding domain-containing protein [Enterocloster lavalensis]RHR57542.1 DNA-binding response regulator [Clostridium sp. AF18-27]